MPPRTEDSDVKVQSVMHSSSADNDQRPPLPFSAFTQTQKWLIIALSSYAACFSPLSSFIFFPAIPALSESLHVSSGKINLTITSYMIVAGLAPTLLGDLADTKGRRLTYLFMMLVYCLANIGLAMQRNWAALFVLRMLQSVGSAATIALGYGIVSDIATPGERGHFVSGMVLGPNIATAVGPILGGALTESAGWYWIFWLLAILSGISLLLIVLLLPETARSVVGDGSGEVPFFNRPILSLVNPNVSTLPRDSLREGNEKESSSVSRSEQKKSHVPNVMGSLKLLLAKDCTLIVLIFGIFYMNLSCVQASTSTLFINIYHISELGAGLVYLPAGIGSVFGAYGAGYILNHDYRVTARRNGIPVDKSRSNDLTLFPIEEARLRSITFSICATGLSTIGYGWSLKYHVHMSVPLIFQFVIGLSTAVVFNTSGTLLTDIHPKSPSRASAANSVVRCLLAAAGLALVQVLIDDIDVQWTFTLFGLLSLTCLLSAFALRRYGKHWRDKILQGGVER